MVFDNPPQTFLYHKDSKAQSFYLFFVPLCLGGDNNSSLTRKFRVNYWPSPQQVSLMASVPS